jgi:hypothetical protein
MEWMSKLTMSADLNAVKEWLSDYESWWLSERLLWSHDHMTPTVWIALIPRTCLCLQIIPNTYWVSYSTEVAGLNLASDKIKWKLKIHGACPWHTCSTGVWDSMHGRRFSQWLGRVHVICGQASWLVTSSLHCVGPAKWGSWQANPGSVLSWWSWLWKSRQSRQIKKMNLLDQELCVLICLDLRIQESQEAIQEGSRPGSDFQDKLRFPDPDEHVQLRVPIQQSVFVI